MNTPSLDYLVERATARKRPLRVAVVCGYDNSTRTAVANAVAAGYVSAIFVDDATRAVEAHSSQREERDSAVHIATPYPTDAARTAVNLVREGRADAVMKGLVGTDILLRAILDKGDGLLPAGGTLTHVSVAAIPAYERLLCFSDAAVIPYPTPAQRRVQVAAVVGVCRAIGVDEPRVALIHCSEKTSEKFPHAADYRCIVAEAEAGCWGRVRIDGPLDLRTAIDPVALAVKGIESPLEGCANGLIFPDIEAANVFYKTVTSLCHGEMAGMLYGTIAPVVLPSRGDDAQTKSYSLALAALMADRRSLS